MGGEGDTPLLQSLMGKDEKTERQKERTKDTLSGIE